MASLLTLEQLEVEKERFESPAQWPLWPLLPVKRVCPNLSGREFGVVTPDYPHIVIRGHAYEMCGTELTIIQLAHDGDVPGLKTFPYETVDALLADGWIID